MSQRAAEARLRRIADKAGVELVKVRRTGKWGVCREEGELVKINGGASVELEEMEAWLAKHYPHAMPQQRRDWTAIVLAASEIVRGFDTSVTLRQLFYQLVASQIIENTRQDYNTLSRKTGEARREGTFPDLIDKTSRILVPQWYSSPEDAIERLRRTYRRDRT
jgi:hypothetical protein